MVSDPNVIVGMESPDDAGVYRISDDIALIETLDFFTPIVDDPYIFGQIAVANALSDVYAMGGRPLLAMNIICFPIKDMDMSVLERILCGGLDKLKEASVVLLGGHSVEDKELKYGLSVTGIVHPKKVIRKRGAKAGDKLILTKPIGTGIISTALKADIASPKAVEKIINSMSSLNKKACEVMGEYHVNACTDITGFGLLGHACEMINGSDIGMIIYFKDIPIFKEAFEYADMGLVPGGTYRNRDFYKGMVDGSSISDPELIVLFDAQTSGGLLISVEDRDAERLLSDMKENGVSDASIIGEVVEEPKRKILIL